MAGISWEEAGGEVKGKTKPAEKAKSSGGISWEEAGGEKGTSKSIGRRALDEAVNVGDLIASTPAFISGVAADAASRVGGSWGNILETLLPNKWVTEKSKPFLPTNDPKVQTERNLEARRGNAQSGLKAYETAMKIGGNPISRLMGLAGYEADMENTFSGKALNKLASGIEAAGEWTEEKTGGGLLKEDVQSLANAAMFGIPKAVGAVVKSGKAAYRGVTGKAEPGSIDIPPPVGEPAPKGLPIADPARMSLPELARYYQEKVDTAAETSAKARKQRAADIRYAFEQGKTDAGDTLNQLQARFEESSRQSERYAAEEAAREQAANDARSYETQTPEVPDTTSSDILRVMQKPAFERTAEDLLVLRDARNKALGLGIGAGALAALADDSEDAAGAAAVLGLAASKGGFRGPARQVGAVKLGGGMWHPEAVEKLSTALRGFSPEKILEREAYAKANDFPADSGMVLETQELRAFSNHADRMVSNWLNKYAGTDKDPLKDVQIPFGEGTKRLEEVTDKAFGARIKGQDADVANLPAKEGETVWSLNYPKFGEAAKTALNSYLSHVGDYLRQNVPPEKLQQYDLVRAVRETALNDARVAKAMEKEAQNASMGLPTHAEYADGFKWVELKLPEKLTEEQMKGVAPDHGTWLAVDAADKPIRNNYTGETARGTTPEEAYLAGQLAREGNTMGHCVGGYCEGVASGESRIFSLRDPKGQSHVTVEVEPGRAPGERPDVLTGKTFNDIQGRADNILQIKGKQNRAPDSRYLPYVQDFVKGGKWGEVGDLENTGLHDFSTADNPGRYVSTKEIAEKAGVSPVKVVDFLQGLLKHDDPLWMQISEAVHKGDYSKAAESSIKRIPPGQRGAADPELLAKIGVIGGGAALLAAMDDEEPETAALLGAGLGYAVLKLPWSKIGKGAEYIGGIASTRIGNMSEGLKLKMRDFERRNLERQYTYKSLGDKFLIELNKLPKAQQKAVKIALLSGDPQEMSAAMEATGRPELAAEWGKASQVMDHIGGELEALGRTKKITGYFPRIVDDLPGLLKALGSNTKVGLEKALAAAEDKAMKSRGEGLNEIERSKIVNQYLLEPLRGEGRPGWSRHRRVQEITEKLEPYYLDPTASFHTYVRRAAMDIEKAKLFGKDAVTVKDPGGLQHLDTQKSIGALVDKELQSGKLTQEQATELRGLLRSRFEGGERVSSAPVQIYRNLANLGMLGQIVAAIPQAGDVATVGAVQGFKPTLHAVAKVLSGKNELSMRDMGLIDHISEEFITADKLANAVNKTFKWSGFSAIDAFGKNVGLNTARLKFEKLAKTPEGQAEIARKYGEAYGEDLPKLLQDLKDGKLTDSTRSLYFSELSDMQPITKLEMPQGYLDNPNGRLLYTFKSFMLKQLDLMRNKGYNEIKKGNVKEGLSNLTRLGLTLGVAGVTTDMIKNYLLGKDFDPEWEDVPMNMLKTFGLSRFILDKAREGDWKDVVSGMAGPPSSMFEDILKRKPEAIKYLPIVGQILYGQSEEGQKKYEKQKKQEEMRKIDRELKPLFGKPSEEIKDEIKRRKQLLRELQR